LKLQLKKIKNHKMTQRIKILIGIFILIFIIFWAGWLNSFSDILYWLKVSKNSEIIAAEIALEKKLEELRKMKPIRDKEIAGLEIAAKSAISIFLNSQNNEERTLFEKEIDQQLAIASLTKLMTAWVVLEHYDLSREITISKLAANQYGDIKGLEQGKNFTVEYLLYPLLIESSNSAAFALAENGQEITGKNFIELMNLEAEKMGLENTFFINPTGLDSELPETKINQSTAQELVKLTKNLLKKPLIKEILSLPKYSLYGPELISTNKFLFENADEIIGGKTGYTSKAGGCFLLIIEAPKNQGYLINIILGTNGRENRFKEMEKLIDWLKIAYKW
jgi:serine-type D-Ala-D-Ala carboxypeptidase (penicillin-binding protein 5/6)